MEVMQLISLVLELLEHLIRLIKTTYQTTTYLKV